MERIFPEPITMKDISELPEADKYLLMLTLSSSIRKLHEQGLVYADLRHDNVLFMRSEAGKVISKLIDFDGCYFEEPTLPEDIPISPAYIAPETALVHFYEEKEISLSRKVDVFSLALMFHLYWTGELPEIDTGEYDYIFQQVLDEKPLTLSPKLPDRLAALMTEMLAKDPDDRPAMAQVFEELKDIMKPKPKNRIEIGSHFYIPLSFQSAGEGEDAVKNEGER